MGLSFLEFLFETGLLFSAVDRAGQRDVDLHRADDQREQSYSERQLYEAALERLTREVAAVSGVDEAGAAKQVDQVLVGRAA